MTLAQISMSDLVVAAAGAPRFRVKYMPVMTLWPELHTKISHEIGLFCMADETQTFILHNIWVGGDEWDSELQDYTAPIWETAVLRSTSDLFDKIPTGPDSTYRLEWPDGIIVWNNVGIEILAKDEASVILSMVGARVGISAFNGKPHEFIHELWLVGAAGEWQLKRSAFGPSGYTLVSGEPTY